MIQTRELTGHEKFTSFHAALLVFCLDALGCCFILAADTRPAFFPLLGMLLFLACSWYGMLLLCWQWRTRDVLVFAALLTAVNATWGAWLVLLRDPVAPFWDEHLVWASILCGLGFLATCRLLVLRRRPTGPRVR